MIDVHEQLTIGKSIIRLLVVIWGHDNATNLIWCHLTIRTNVSSGGKFNHCKCAWTDESIELRLEMPDHRISIPFCNVVLTFWKKLLTIKIYLTYIHRFRMWINRTHSKTEVTLKWTPNFFISHFISGKFNKDSISNLKNAHIKGREDRENIISSLKV